MYIEHRLVQIQIISVEYFRFDMLIVAALEYKLDLN